MIAPVCVTDCSFARSLQQQLALSLQQQLARGHFSSAFRAVTSAAPFALLLQHLARSAIGVAHDDRAALFAVD